jgi:hypothetical protein
MTRLAAEIEVAQVAGGTQVSLRFSNPAGPSAPAA